jgi:DsbC/DsbD-like thiol-disulfide interchange protein
VSALPHRARPLVLLPVLLLGCHPAPAPRSPTVGDAQVRATLLADAAAVTPGRPVELRVRFDIAPGWHIYAEDPGESGLPTRVAFTAPMGFFVGPTRYPPPETFTSPGPIRSFGYQREAVLSAPLEAPARLVEPRVTLRARVSWLACQEACIPGRAELALTLPVRAAPNP